MDPSMTPEKAEEEVEEKEAKSEEESYLFPSGTELFQEGEKPISVKRHFPPGVDRRDGFRGNRAFQEGEY